ncbi:hypothetical protein SAMN05444162_1451 [Paenibacillaceae bacterium GAS479]|nr:hypothetical protein SAMN05444162_1451 [Paenibacillaceae bacterium GAS479]
MGASYNKSFTLNNIKKDLVAKSTTDESKEELVERIEYLENADYVYLSETGEVYSSKRGYLGKAEKQATLTENNAISSLAPMSQADPTPSEIHGGSTGAFERKQLNFSGFDGITGNVTLLSISNLGANEQPWVYYGFDSNTQGGIEGGYAYQTGTKKWLPFIRNANGFVYADPTYAKLDGNVVNNFKFYVRLQTDQTYYTAYLIDGGATVRFASTPFTNISSLSVKRATSIAKEGFNGSNISGKSMNQKWDSIQVSKSNSDYYFNWSDYSEYSSWTNNKWYGTIDCIASYIYRSGGFTSIYKQ